MSKFTIPRKVLYVCTGSKCGKRGGKDMYKAAKSFLKHSPNGEEMEVIRTDCTDRCKFAPVCAIQPDNVWLKEYHQKEVLRWLLDDTEPGV